MVINEENIGAVLKKCRLEKGMTKSELSRKSTISLPAIIRYERGDVAPTMRSMLALMDALEANIEIK